MFWWPGTASSFQRELWCGKNLGSVKRGCLFRTCARITPFTVCISNSLVRTGPALFPTEVRPLVLGSRKRHSGLCANLFGRRSTSHGIRCRILTASLTTLTLGRIKVSGRAILLNNDYEVRTDSNGTLPTYQNLNSPVDPP